MHTYGSATMDKAEDQTCFNCCYYTEREGHNDLIIRTVWMPPCICCGKEKSSFFYGCSANEHRSCLCEACAKRYDKAETYEFYLYPFLCFLGGILACAVFPCRLFNLGPAKKVKFITTETATELVSQDPLAIQGTDIDGFPTVTLKGNTMQVIER